MNNPLRLTDFALIGRTYDEYHKMFDLDNLIGNEKILDVASGVSSFCAEANAKGCDVTASDQVYNSSQNELKKRSKQDLDMVIRQMSDVSDSFIWNYFKNIESLKEQRSKSRKMFFDDYEKYSKKNTFQ